MPLYLGTQKIKNLSIGEANLGITDLNTNTTTPFTGLIKGENGYLAQAVPEEDYLTSASLDTFKDSLSLGSLATKSSVSADDLDSGLIEKINNPTVINKTNNFLTETRIGLGGARPSSTSRRPYLLRRRHSSGCIL